MNRLLACALLATSLLGPGIALAANTSDVANTLHNLSTSGTGTVRAAVGSTTEICVFCHTPHGATTFPGSPLWNRQVSGQTYTVYTSSSLDAEDIAGQLDQPGGSSKLCLSCHDGTLALGTVNVTGGQTAVTFPMTGTETDGTMPVGAGTATGFSRDLGIELRNDHPISLTFDTTLATTDGELFDPATAAHIGIASPGLRPTVPLETIGVDPGGQIQCATCHDAHVRDATATASIKFLRLNRFQQAAPVVGAFSSTNDIICLACHDKEGWTTSAHATTAVANETYAAAASAQREFPSNVPVWQAACLNCHDTHTVSGARRLLREGTDSTAVPKSGGNPAIEQTCYQCHTDTASTILNLASNLVPNIRTDFVTLARHMPITGTDQNAGDPEVHDVVDADLTEPRLQLGVGNTNNRHVECTDCHNPHRVMKNRLFNGSSASTAAGTHDHATVHTNISSGVLRGSWGVEPVYGSIPFLSLPTSYTVKKGDGGIGASTAVGSTWVTREYQICLKCHSDYGYTDNNFYPIGDRPGVGSSGGGTPSGTNNLTIYTNQAMEFQAPTTHKREVTTINSGAGASYTTNNHRSWHPVMDSTGRTTAISTASATAWLAPWNTVAAIGAQTMYCTDCHGSNTANNTVVPPGGEDGNPWGPHGSGNDFILKGAWNSTTGSGSRDAPAPTDPNNGLCFKCHDFRTYADRNGNGRTSGFGGSVSSNLHAFHTDKIQRIRCSWCHIAIPHGWKNKALLVNLNDVGPEAGLTAGTQVRNHTTAAYNQEPYYLNAMLKVITFRASGAWTANSCGSAGAPGNGEIGKNWMNSSDEACVNAP